MSIKICPKCGKEFSCEGDNDCWCEKVQIHRKQLLELMENYTDCICPDCMKGYEKE